MKKDRFEFYCSMKPFFLAQARERERDNCSKYRIHLQLMAKTKTNHLILEKLAHLQQSSNTRVMVIFYSLTWFTVTWEVRPGNYINFNGFLTKQRVGRWVSWKIFVERRNTKLVGWCDRNHRPVMIIVKDISISSSSSLRRSFQVKWWLMSRNENQIE